MMALTDIAKEIELHSLDGIKQCFSHGVTPNDLLNGEPLIYELTSEYTRSPRFKDCVKLFVDHGLQFEDEVLLAILLNDPIMLTDRLKTSPDAIFNRYTLRCAYTPLYEATLLHLCAEFNHVACAEVLVTNGTDVNAKAGTDEHGFGGQTPIFHTVNQNSNQSADMMNFLLSNSADLHTTVKGLIWGKSYSWETLIPSVNPISYAMMGLLPQMHRREETISEVITTLLRHAYGIEYHESNIPNAYLKR
jgi:hypothetical protein